MGTREIETSDITCSETLLQSVLTLFVPFLFSSLLNRIHRKCEDFVLHFGLFFHDLAQWFTKNRCRELCQFATIDFSHSGFLKIDDRHCSFIKNAFRKVSYRRGKRSWTKLKRIILFQEWFCTLCFISCCCWGKAKAFYRNKSESRDFCFT